MLAWVVPDPPVCTIFLLGFFVRAMADNAGRPPPPPAWHAAFATAPPFLEFRVGAHGLGGFATSPIPPGATLLALPYARALNEPYAARTVWGRAAAPFVAASPSRLSGRIVLYLAMMGEAGEGEGEEGEEGGHGGAARRRSPGGVQESTGWW